MPLPFYAPDAVSGENALALLRQAAAEGSRFLYGSVSRLVFSAAVVALILAGFRLLTDGERGAESAARTAVRCAAAVLAVRLLPFLLGLIRSVFAEAGSLSLWGSLAG